MGPSFKWARKKNFAPFVSRAGRSNSSAHMIHARLIHDLKRRHYKDAFFVFEKNLIKIYRQWDWEPWRLLYNFGADPWTSSKRKVLSFHGKCVFA